MSTNTEQVVLNDPPPVILNDPVVPPVAAVPEPAEPVTPDDEFATMFTKFSTPEEPKPAVPPVVATPEPAVVPPVAVTPEPVVPEPAPQPDPMERLADMLAQRQPAPVQQHQQPSPQPQMFTPDEATALTDFYKEWPEIARAQELALRAAVQQTTNHVFTEVARVLGPRLQLLEQLANNVQYDTLEKRVPDYDNVIDKVAAWVETQPAYLRAAYTGVMQQGSTTEVEDLIGRYRQAAGATNPPVGNPPPVNTPPVLSPAAKQAAARLAPVSGKRTTPAQGQPVDFDNAFAQFASAG